MRPAAGDGGDVFKAIWNAGRSAPHDAPVTPADREKAKRTVYGILYGQDLPDIARLVIGAHFEPSFLEPNGIL
jgi:hypothetical protein